MGRHLVEGFEGLLREVMYVFDDAVVFVSPPPSVKLLDGLGLLTRKLKAAKVPTFHGEDAASRLASDYVEDRKFQDIVAFSPVRCSGLQRSANHFDDAR